MTDRPRVPRVKKRRQAMLELGRLSVDDGIAFLQRPRAEWVLSDVRVTHPSGLALFQREYATGGAAALVCCQCRCMATHFAATKHPNDVGGAFGMNLYANNRLMTQDHIVPKSLGGSDHVDNMRVMCESCNRKRGNAISLTELLHGALWPMAVKSTPALKDSLNDLVREAMNMVQPLRGQDQPMALAA